MDLDPRLAPVTVNHFVSQARSGFYDGLTFHRVVPGFVIQGGDPEGTGRGGPGYKFADEPVKGEYTLGAVAMANAGPDTNGSQFFICIDDCTTKLQPLYNLFGYVTSGIEVAQSIKVGDKIASATVTGAPRRLSPLHPLASRHPNGSVVPAGRCAVGRGALLDRAAVGRHHARRCSSSRRRRTVLVADREAVGPVLDAELVAHRQVAPADRDRRVVAAGEHLRPHHEAGQLVAAGEEVPDG